jgi:hypothetical protein
MFEEDSDQVIYEAEIDPKEEATVLYQFFLEKIKPIIHHITELWKSCSEGNVSFEVATIITETGMERMVLLESAFTERLKEFKIDPLLIAMPDCKEHIEATGLFR